jgi:hypothetical protein
MQLEPIDLRKLDEIVANVYEGVIVAAKEAKKINEEQRLEYNNMVTTIPSKGIDDDAEDIENPDQLKVSLEFEKRPKPHVKALKQLMGGEIEYLYKNDK